MSNDQGNKAIDVTVNVYYVGAGGNSPSGQYFFRFSEDVVHVTKPKQLIHYTLAPDSFKAGIRFDGFYVSDSNNQIHRATQIDELTETGRRISLIHDNTESMLLNISLQVTGGGDVPGCRGGLDPQITNVPSPH
jgi:hypothetical protein